MDSAEEKYDIVIVGGGIGGLATALALHIKGFTSIVLEKSDTLRATGAAIGIWANGWRALDQLGVSSHLRQTALPMERARDIWIDEAGKQQERPLVTDEGRGLKRSDLMNTLADALPRGTIQFGSQVVSLQVDPKTKYPTLQLSNGRFIRAKLLIGCDGSKSTVADFLGLNPPRQFALRAIRGLTDYPKGHTFSQEFIRMRRGNILIGRIPITNNSVFWFLVQQSRSDAELPYDPELIKRSAIESFDGFPSDIQELISNCDQNSLSFTHLRYRAPWDFLLGHQFQKGTVTVVGDAMHVMGPFLGQGGSASIEDAVVLARNLAQKVSPVDLRRENWKQTMIDDKVENALDQYVKERRMRVFRLSMQSYLFGVMLEENKSPVTRFIASIFMAALFSDVSAHTKYDCGRL